MFDIFCYLLFVTEGFVLDPFLPKVNCFCSGNSSVEAIKQIDKTVRFFFRLFSLFMHLGWTCYNPILYLENSPTEKPAHIYN